VALRTVGVRLTAEIGEYQSKLKAAAQSTKRLQGRAGQGRQEGQPRQGRRLGRHRRSRPARAGWHRGQVGGRLRQGMSSVSAATHAPKAELDQLRAAALQAGKDTQFSATQAADGITELSKAGVSTADILGGGLKGALSLAAAGQLSVGEAAETAASAMTQFKLKGDQIPHVADLLAAGAGKAQGSVHDMGAALNQSGLVAAQFGLSIEDTTGALAEFASAGLTGSDAGTSLKTMLLAIANPSKQTRDEMDSLGISFYDAHRQVHRHERRRPGPADPPGASTTPAPAGTRPDLRQRRHPQSASILYTDGARASRSGRTRSTTQATQRRDRAEADRQPGRRPRAAQGLARDAGDRVRVGANGGLRVLAKTLNEVVNQFGLGQAAQGDRGRGRAAVLHGPGRREGRGHAGEGGLGRG
jgi:hypothetical protein